MSLEEAYNYRRVDDRLVTAGQPREEQLRAAAADGFTAVINLATIDPRYSLEDEAGLVASLGMTYHHVPVDWERPLESDFEAFERLMRSLPEGKVLVHCAANFRVTAFYALYAQKHLGWSEAQAEEFRASIWRGKQFPAWDAFLARVRAGLAADQRKV